MKVCKKDNLPHHLEAFPVPRSLYSYTCCPGVNETVKSKHASKHKEIQDVMTDRGKSELQFELSFTIIGLVDQKL